MAGQNPNSAADEAKPGKTYYSVQTPIRTAPGAEVSVTTALPREKNLAGVTPRAPKLAVFVAHGMGQQIAFQTLDQVAGGLRREDAERLKVDLTALPTPVARTVEVDGEQTQRIELRLHTARGAEREAHIYEGYWAPLTEGQVKLRDVVAFLFGAGYNGLRLARRPFRRWLFGHYHQFLTPVRTPVYLLLALAVVAALVVMNTTVVTVAAALSPLTRPSAWLSKELLADLTTTFNLWLTFVAAFAVVLLLAKAAQRAKARLLVRRTAGGLAAIFFYLTVAATVLAGAAIPLLFYGHVIWAKADGQSNSARLEFWRKALSDQFVEAFNNRFGRAVLALLVVAAAFFLLVLVMKFVAAGWHEVRAGKPGRWSSLLAVVGLLGIGLAIAALMAAFVRLGEGMAATTEQPILTWRGLSWPLLVLISAYVRKLMIQYVGDVAAYITPYRLDRFANLRAHIRQRVFKKVRAVYSARGAHGDYEYDGVFVVGHSLGAVVVYDAINRLINDDLISAKGSPDVIERTRLLLTFGAPLDKIAFLFALQANQTSEAREALAAATQPLIQDYQYRPFPWINLYSQWDIISGPLDFYDPPNGNDLRRVNNQPDEDASTLIVAHVEYWKNRRLFQTLHDKLTS